MLERSLAISSGAPNVLRVSTTTEFGAMKERLELCQYLSLVVRVSEPGYSKELQADLDRVFEESRVIPGFTGYVVGYRDTLEEEVIGIASWDGEESFRSSLPQGIIASVVGYRSAW
jgi:hypothetical protein